MPSSTISLMFVAPSPLSNIAIQLLEREIIPRLDKLRSQKRTFLEFQNIKSERDEIAGYLLSFDYFNTKVSP